MERFRVAGGARLAGEVHVAGAKNSVLKLMAAALLAAGRTTLTTCRASSTSRSWPSCCAGSGCEVEARRRRDVVIDVPQSSATEADYDLVRRMRASICVLGPLLARCGEAEVALPGGDTIGSRGLDMHVAGLRAMGAEVDSEHGFLIADGAARACTARQIWLDFPSVGATENILMAAVLADGMTMIDNAAREPEIVDLCRMLVAMGAQIDGVGTSTLEVKGVDGAARRSSTPRCPTGSSPARGRSRAAMTRGDVTVRNARRRAPGDRARQARRDAGADGRRARRRLPGRDGRAAAARSTS